MESYVDDFFGGPKRSKNGISGDKRKADLMFEELLAVGDLTGAKMNRKKCLSPARVMEILGFIYDSIVKTCRLSVSKQRKYIRRINQVLKSTGVTFKMLEKLVGNLTYAAWIAPFGRPFLSTLSEMLQPSKGSSPIVLTPSMRSSLNI